MKLKLSNSEFTTLYVMLKQVIVDADVRELEHRLMKSILIEVYKKMHVKAVFVRREYSVRFTESEALAFYLLFFDHTFAHTTHEGNLLNRIILIIHQKIFSNVT